MLEVFDAARHAQLTARVCSLSPYCSDKGCGYAIGINAASEGIRFWESRMRERVGCAEATDSIRSLRCLFFLFVSPGVCGRERRTYAEEKGVVVIDGRIGGLCIKLWLSRSQRSTN